MTRRRRRRTPRPTTSCRGRVGGAGLRSHAAAPLGVMESGRPLYSFDQSYVVNPVSHAAADTCDDAMRRRDARTRARAVRLDRATLGAP